MVTAAQYLLWFCFGVGALLVAGILTAITAGVWKHFAWEGLKTIYKLECLRYYMHLAERRGRLVRRAHGPN